MKCPHCGAEVEGNAKFCEYCGSKLSLGMVREQEQLNKKGCPKCGSSNVKFRRESQAEIQGRGGKQYIKATVGVCEDCGFTWYPNEEEFRATGALDDAPANDNPAPPSVLGNGCRGSMIWWILGWIFFFPAPVMVLIWRKKNTWDIKIKILVTVVFWLFVFGIGSKS